jgi:beta-galactosidase GanA
MRHVRETDGEQQTVIMVQVENEIGMIPEARDRTALADELFAAPVPAELLRHLEGRGDELAPELRSLWTRQGRRTSGTWPEVFGDGPAGAEIFMAWHFARYVEGVASAGKAEYPLPMYVNAALVRPGALPGQYPSAGPLPHLIDVWRAGAPSIDFLAPDIYFPTFPEWCRLYTRSGNPLFVPEALRTPDASVRVLYAVGQHDALGFAPFAIESIPEPAASRLAESYDLLGRLAPVLDEQRGSGSMAGLLPPGPDGRQPQQVPLGDLVLSVSYERRAPQSLADGGIVPPPPEAESLPAGGLVIASAPDELVFVGIGVTVTFAAASPSRQTVGILSVEEVNFAEGRWSHVRWVNGDQTHQGRHVRLEPGRLAIQRVRLYRY